MLNLNSIGTRIKMHQQIMYIVKLFTIGIDHVFIHLFYEKQARILHKTLKPTLSFNKLLVTVQNN